MEKLKEASAEIWHFLKTHAEVKDTDEWWKETLDTANEIIEKYHDGPCEKYAREYMGLVLSEITQEYRKGKNQ